MISIGKPGGPMKTRVIMVDGVRAGWIRPAFKGYLVKVYGATIVRAGDFPTTTSDCQWVSDLNTANALVADLLKTRSTTK